MRHIEILKSLGACPWAIDWAKSQPDLETAWNNCQRSDWMLWLAHWMPLFTDKDLRLMACQFVRRTPMGDGTVWDSLDDAHKNCVVAAERYANGDATKEELHSAWASALDSARALALDSARTSAGASALDSARTSAGASALASARASALDSARAFQSDIVREFGNPFKGNEVNK